MLSGLDVTVSLFLQEFMYEEEKLPCLKLIKCLFFILIDQELRQRMDPGPGSVSCLFPSVWADRRILDG